MSDLLLAIDTSTRYAGVALSSGDQLIAEYTWQAGINHTRQLLPVVKAVLVENATKLEDVGVIAVASGPGSFNGLRVGVTTAKAFAQMLDVPLVAVGTLEVEAYPHAAFPGPICPVHDAGRGEIAWAIYKAPWECLYEPHITKPEALAQAIKKPTLLCGEPPGWALEPLDMLVHASPSASVRRPAALAELAWQRYESGDHADPSNLQPLYLRRPPGDRP
jgi:tRNA threonylcarbamoyladenosine biosynthesis protein TsaB